MMRLSRPIAVIVSTIAFLAVMAIGIFALMRPVAMLIARSQMERTFNPCSVTIGDCDIDPARAITFKDIIVKKKDGFEFKIHRASILYNIVSLIKGGLPELNVEDPVIAVNTPNAKISDLGRLFGAGKSPSRPLVKAIQASGIKLKISTQDFAIDAAISFGCDTSKLILTSLDLQIANLDGAGVSIKDAMLKASQKGPTGIFSCKKISYNKVTITDISGNAILGNNSMAISRLSAVLFNSPITGSASVTFGKKISYEVDTKAASIDIDKVVHDLNLSEKIQMSGMMAGEFLLKGKDLNIRILRGILTATAPGGMLIIKDDKFFEAIAAKIKQPVDLVKESFKDYHYATGTVLLSLEGNGLVFDISMEGEKGKRAIKIFLHDINIRR